MMKRHGRAAADQSYGGVFVYNRPEQVLEQYDLEVRAVSKGRESYICDTTQGQLLLKEYKGSAERAEFLSATSSFAAETGPKDRRTQLLLLERSMDGTGRKIQKEPAGTKEPAGSFCVAGQSGRPDRGREKAKNGKSSL